MSNGSLITDDAMDVLIKDALNEGMLKAAEPIIQKALKEVEMEMRAKMASMLISYLDNQVSMERFGRDLRILIKNNYDSTRATL